ncbi:MAG TPA: DUF4265 domain-containing protein [Actinocrinis sp.]|nr:DUF4265 domain-containing protein [Actinocrinis sp.]
MTGDRDGYVKVHFALGAAADGWPPVGSESMWAVDLGGGLARVDNVPWFVPRIAANDVVRAAPDEHGTLWFVERVTASGNCTIRVLPFPDGALAGSRKAVIDLFEPMGVYGEGVEQYGLVALDVPPGADLAAVKGQLIRGQHEGWWNFEEGCVGDAWIEASTE